MMDSVEYKEHLRKVAKQVAKRAVQREIREARLMRLFFWFREHGAEGCDDGLCFPGHHIRPRIIVKDGNGKWYEPYVWLAGDGGDIEREEVKQLTTLYELLDSLTDKNFDKAHELANVIQKAYSGKTYSDPMKDEGWQWA